MDLPKILLTGLVFWFFWFSSSFWTVGAWDSKNLEKNQKKTKKTILNGLTQDSSHRIGFFVFFVFFGFPRKKYVNIPSEKYIYVHYIYVCICVYTYLCKMDERRSFASLCHKNG